jgi:hypothetical protein
MFNLNLVQNDFFYQIGGSIALKIENLREFLSKKMSDSFLSLIFPFLLDPNKTFRSSFDTIVCSLVNTFMLFY